MLTINYRKAEKVKLKWLPETIGDLEQLYELFISNNNLKQIPATIGKLTRLEALDLSDNQLTSLPDEIRNLKGSLRELNIERNPGSFKKL